MEVSVTDFASFVLCKERHIFTVQSWLDCPGSCCMQMTWSWLLSLENAKKFRKWQGGKKSRDLNAITTKVIIRSVDGMPITRSGVQYTRAVLVVIPSCVLWMMIGWTRNVVVYWIVWITKFTLFAVCTMETKQWSHGWKVLIASGNRSPQCTDKILLTGSSVWCRRWSRCYL